MISITNISKRMMGSCLLLMLFLAQSLTSSAQVKLYMEDFTIASGEVKEVSLMLDNEQEATALQVSIELPAKINYVNGSVAKTDRVKGRGADVQASISTGKLVIVETGGTIEAGTGAVITFQVQASGALQEGDYGIKLTNIVVSDASANQLNVEEENTATVTVMGLQTCSFGATESIEIAVNQEYQVDVTLSNEGVTNLAAFQGKLILPEGLEIVPGEDGKFIYSDRTPVPLEFKFQEFEGYTSFILSSSSNKLITGTSGVIFSFKVKANTRLAETSEIKLTDLRVAATTGASQLCDDVTISVTNTSVADEAAFEEYKAEQTEAVEALAEEGDSEAAQAIIADAVAAIEALAFDYDKSLEENKAAVDEVVEPVAEALAEQRAAEQLAADKAAFEAYKAEQVAAVEALAEEGDSEASQAIIADAVAVIEALEYDEDKSLEENKAAVEEAAAPVAEALAEQRAAEQLAADKAAFDAYKAEQVAAVEALAEEGDSEASQAIIADAVAAIEALEYDEEKSLEENKAAVEEIAAPVAEALAEQRAADAILLGDVNGDGVVDLSDSIMVTYYSLHVAPANFNEAAADVNGDGQIDLSDAITIIYISLGVK